MAAGAVYSGKTGKLYKTATEVVHFKKWTFTDMVETHAFASSSTAGRKARVVGNGDSSGSFEVMCHDGEYFPFASGEAVTLKLEVDTANYITVEAVIQQKQIEVDRDGGTPVMIAVTFEGNGAVTYTGPAFVD
jgi:hypothetical protein